MWELATKARMGLPFRVGKLSILKQPDTTSTRLQSVVIPRADGDFDAYVVDDKGEVYLALYGYRTMEMPEQVEASLLEPLRNAFN